MCHNCRGDFWQIFAQIQKILYSLLQEQRKVENMYTMCYILVHTYTKVMKKDF